MTQNCGNCQYVAVRDMYQGEVTKIRCEHPTVTAAYDSGDVPDWLYEKNAFAPTEHGQHCDAWKAQP